VSAPSIIGHAAPLTRLEQAFARDRLPHALLLAGPAGIGKATVAHALAARLLCARGGAAACGTCDRCLQLAARTHPDYLAVSLQEGKKEIGIDLVRLLKRFIVLRPVAGRHKVAFIDDAERLSLAAQNALLKTLEEPPPASLLLLVTASPRALLPTVRSRCQAVVFQPLSTAEVETALRQQAGVDAAEVPPLAALADGSPGRALALRALLRDESRRALRDSLAALDVARYGSVVNSAKLLGRSEPDMQARLELMQTIYRDAAVRAARGEAAEEGSPLLRDAEHGARAVAIVGDALQLLRRNANRPLLSGAVLLRLARN
jgi:DNA polymerase-3 subunit delta'